NVVGNYTFQPESRLRGVNIGASYRWQQASTTGFPVITDSDGVMKFDVDNPYKGADEGIVDIWAGYERMLTDKIKWRIQANVRNLFATKDLVPVTVQPDGTHGGYRIPEPMVWTITNTFTF